MAWILLAALNSTLKRYVRLHDALNVEKKKTKNSNTNKMIHDVK